MRSPERTEASLGARPIVRIAPVQWGAVVDQPQAGVEVGLEQNVNVDIRAQIAAVPDVARSWINLIGCERASSILHDQPRGGVGHIIPPGHIGVELLFDGDRTEIHGFEAEIVKRTDRSGLPL